MQNRRLFSLLPVNITLFGCNDNSYNDVMVISYKYCHTSFEMLQRNLSLLTIRV